MDLPAYAWTRALDEPEPDASTHTHFKPFFLEALSLLPVAFRVGSYIYTERSNGKEPIFDLNGITLSPPHPGPHAGAPMGGLGGGAIGRGFKGEFRRWSLHAGRYHHHVVCADVLVLRVKRPSGVQCKVLSLFKPTSPRSTMGSWDWSLDASCGKYYAVFPLSWTVYEEPLPGVRITVRQLSPFLPGNYAESSLPVGCFSVEVQNLHREEAEVSVMLVFQNGTEQAETEVREDWAHFPFSSSINKELKGVCMPHRSRRTVVHTSDTSTTNEALRPLEAEGGLSFVEDKGCFAIAAEGEQGEVSVCSKFISLRSTEEGGGVFSFCSSDEGRASQDEGLAAAALWRDFHDNGNIRSLELPPHREGAVYAGAVCIHRTIGPGAADRGNTSVFDFSLAWDHPVARFGAGLGLPRFYTRFFGSTGNVGPLIAAFALHRKAAWYAAISIWQAAVIAKVDAKYGRVEEREWYYSQIFNELYYLVDGGTLWTDSSCGCSNQPVDLLRPVDQLLVDYEASIQTIDGTVRQAVTMKRSRVDQGADDGNIKLSATTGRVLAGHVVELSPLSLAAMHGKMDAFNALAVDAAGDQTVVGQFLYLEGHEYLMYNTYDVHFYASFALLMLWPQLELSLQRDFAAAVPVKDSFVRRMMGEGAYCERKAKDFLPHDLGSPSEEPWRCLNAYNFQDVSRWKDLGPKFVLQVYRDHLHTNLGQENKNMRFLSDMYPAAVTIMHQMEAFDTDGDGMIENSGFPDQTYDIWIASGVHAYCGGLWIAACEAMAAMARLQGQRDIAEHYAAIATKARVVYTEKLWNGQYLNYDSSNSSHHDSIMADMLAGQWYAHVCSLPPPLSAQHALSCLRTIFQHNVLEFGQGRYLGAVNGMRPAAGGPATVDNCCIQSREVWTGTTYALSSVMLLEAASGALDDQQQRELVGMAYNTSRGIHDAGWQDFGYWFATPEAWFRNGNYRSMGYMRPLAIWAMQYAIEK